MSNTNMTFEQRMARLEQIVRVMERGDAPLEESLKLCQEGTELIRSCQALLDEAQLQVTKVTADAQEGFREEAFLDAQL